MNAHRLTLKTLISLCVVVGGLLFVWSAPALAQREHAFSASFGGAGSGNGQLSRPGAIAVNESTGDVYVIDRGNGRVEQFSATGVYIGQFDGSASPTGKFSWAAEDLEEGAITVDNSTNPLDPSAGDVYVSDMGHKVVDKFSATGAYEGQITGTSTFRFQELYGVGVDPNGNVWVQGSVGSEATHNGVKEYNDASSNEFVSETQMRFRVLGKSGERSFLGGIGVAIDSAGDLYFGQQEGLRPENNSFVAEFNRDGALLAEEIGGENPATGLGVDRSSNDVYIDNRTSIAVFGPSGASIERFGSGQLSSSEGIGANSQTGTVYASDTASQSIDVFTSFIVPDVETEAASNVRETTATLNGTANPDGLPVSECQFEYGASASYGKSVPCSPMPGSGSGTVSVSADITGLSGLTRYHFRLKVSNANGSNTGQDRTFFTPVPVTVGEESVSDVSATSVRFSGQVNPGGADTTFSFEYGPTTSYGQSVPLPEGDLGSGTSLQPLSVGAEDLQPETTYHVRLAATSVLGTVYGPDQTFTTQSPGNAFNLPDDRQWEMVSPPGKYGASIQALPKQGYVEAAEDGSSVTYIANGPIAASSAGNPSPFWGTQVLSTRVPGGWSSREIVSPNSTVDGNTESSSEFLFFAPDLASALVEPPGFTPLSPEATERTLYVRNNATGTYVALVTSGNVQTGVKFAGGSSNEQVHGVVGTPDLSHVLLESQLALTDDGQSQSPYGPYLYEWTAGKLAL